MFAFVLCLISFVFTSFLFLHKLASLPSGTREMNVFSSQANHASSV